MDPDNDVALSDTQKNTTESIFKSLNQVIWIVTSGSNQRFGGLTATWVHLASIDRESPVIQIGLAPNHFTRELVDRSGWFAVHQLRSDQVDLALNFATGSGRDRDKFANLHQTDSSERCHPELPVLADCLSVMQCQVFHQVDCGDRIYFFGDVHDSLQNGSDAPMRESDFFPKCSPNQIAELKQDMADDINLQRPMRNRFRDQPG